MGPIKDQRGFEQGGANSGDFYKIFGKEQLSTAQASGLGVTMPTTIVSAIGQADDTVLISNQSLDDLQNLLQLSLDFCTKYQVQLCFEKTKLQIISTPPMAPAVEYLKLVSPVNIDGHKIPFADTAEHVGILRNVNGNLPNILNRITAHRKALGATLHTGIARNHRGNPAASVRVVNMYGIPVLLSGLGSLVLLKSEIQMIDHHHKEILENLMRLHPYTPQCVVSFLAGSLPATALLHQKMLSIFGMICRLKSDILHHHASQVLVASRPSSKSWFIEIRNLCLQYGLPHPLTLLQSNIPKEAFKKLVKQHILDFWEIKLRKKAASLDSLEYFHPNFMSLKVPHPIWTTAGPSSYQVTMSTVQASMVSGRYRTELLCSHWSTNKMGFCQAPSCKDHQIQEDLAHILAKCGSLYPTRMKLLDFTQKVSQSMPALKHITDIFLTPSHPAFCQLLLDCSVMPSVISASQQLGPSVHQHLFRISRTWCYCLHKARLQLLGRWKKF